MSRLESVLTENESTSSSEVKRLRVEVQALTELNQELMKMRDKQVSMSTL